MVVRTSLIAMATSTLLAPSAQAILKQYRINGTIIIESTNVSPNPDVNPRQMVPERSFALVDEDGSGNPKLRRYQLSQDQTFTTNAPQLGGFIFISRNYTEGPAGDFTGTGSTDTTIAWGILTGWTITGTEWCKSAPVFICQIGGFPPEESIVPDLLSPLYDLGTWTFHDTGWTGTPFIYRTFETPADGNGQRVMHGVRIFDGRVPVLPLFGIACLGGSLVFGGLVALRGHNG